MRAWIEQAVQMLKDKYCKISFSDARAMKRIQWNPVLHLAPQTGNPKRPALALGNCPAIAWRGRLHERAGFKSHPLRLEPPQLLQEGGAFLPGSTALDKCSPTVFACSLTFRNWVSCKKKTQTGGRRKRKAAWHSACRQRPCISVCGARVHRACPGHRLKHPWQALGDMKALPL